MKKIVHTTCLLLFCFTVLAQNKMLTVEDAVLKQRTSLAPERLSQLMWIPNSHNFVYVAKRNGKECIVKQNADTQKRDTIFTIEDFKTVFASAGTETKMPERFPFFTWIDEQTFRFFYNNGWYTINTESRVVKTLNKVHQSGEEASFEPNTSLAAFVMQNNVYLYDKDLWKKMKDLPTSVDGDMAHKDFMVTNDGSYAIINGKSVHRNEFGINKGLFWSTTGKRLAYYKLNELMVTDYPMFKLSTDTNNNKPGRTETIKYPMAGNTSHHAKVYIYDTGKRLSYMVETGTPDEQYLTNVSWSPDDEYLFIAIVNRDQNEMKLNKYDGRTGKFIKTLITETSSKYVEPEHGPVFPLNIKEFIWFSERDGFNHLYLMDHNGKVIRMLSKGKADVTELLGFNQAKTIVYYMQASEDGLERQLFSAEIATGKITQITRNKGVHTASVSSDGMFVLDSYSSTTMPRRTTLMKSDGAEITILQQAQNPLMDYKACGIRLFNLIADDNKTSLNCRMFYPPDFDSTRKYPVVVYVYGGPHAQMITNSWLGGADMWLYYMAQQGFVVFTMDNRGSSFRGMEFEQATHRNFGTVERNDQLKGVEFLKKQSYVDASRMGVFGWSFGGFMSTGLMSRSDVFKAGVAGGPVIDWRMYEIMYTERYMDSPQQNPQGYEDADLTNYVKNIKGKLLLIHGTEDDVVVWQHTLTYLKKCVDEGVQVDYFVYPGHKHNVTGKDRVHLMQKVANYFKDNL